MRLSKKDLIAETALRLFADGFTTTPVSLIAKTAGVSQGLLYNFFSSKDELLHYILQRGILQVREALQPLQQEKEPSKALQHYLRIVFKRVKDDRDFWKLFFTIRLQTRVTDVIQQDLNDINKHIIETLAKTFRLLGSKHPNEHAWFFQSHVNGIILLYYQYNHFPLEKVAPTTLGLHWPKRKKMISQMKGARWLVPAAGPIKFQ